MSTHLKDIIQKQLGAVEFNTHDPLIAHVAREKTPQLFEEKITPVTFPEQQGMFYIFNWRVYAFYEYTLMQEARGFRILRAMPIDKDKGFDSSPSRTLYGMWRIDLEKAGVDLHILFAALGDPNELNHLFSPVCRTSTCIWPTRETPIGCWGRSTAQKPSGALPVRKWCSFTSDSKHF